MNTAPKIVLGEVKTVTEKNVPGAVVTRTCRVEFPGGFRLVWIGTYWYDKDDKPLLFKLDQSPVVQKCSLHRPVVIGPVGVPGDTFMVELCPGCYVFHRKS
jgi:hypothetical protein